MATLREVQKQRTRALLLECGLESFATKGYQATTIDDIAAAAGATRATFYLHFASKAQLMHQLIDDVDAILTTADDPPLAKVVESGSCDMVREWLDRKFDQWPVIRPYMLVAHRAEAGDPEVAAVLDRWFDGTVQAMQTGLDDADRFHPDARRSRCLLAFGQFEFVSRQWFRRGWLVEREVLLETLTDSWCHLLT
ncbi:TetR/AcrR family transcriptional regulator [Mycolicibacterium baixiangningiae]|uniref:TetR/AcrR family transcriptional regulator n=1 Tax=Mycolicibacterium baixiangningiae TaxID=2761578 RepID=UPI001866CA3A|nr:TetR/AcrR family transcriptional regulator [Mycolicibacterium baixiangningiae]